MATKEKAKAERKKKIKKIKKSGLNVNHKQKWSDLDGLFNTIATSMIQLSSRINQYLQVINKTEYGNNKEVINCVVTMNSDLEKFSLALKKTKDKHGHYKGTVKNTDEYIRFLEIFEEYTSLNEVYNSLITQPMLTITEFHGLSMEAIDEAIDKSKDKPKIINPTKESKNKNEPNNTPTK